VIDRETYDQLTENQYYVPLKGHPTKKGYNYLRSDGISVPRKPFMKAFGRKSMPDNPVIQLVLDYLRMSDMAEKNKALRITKKLIDENPDPAFWEVTPETFIPNTNAHGETNYMKRQGGPYELDKWTVRVKVNEPVEWKHQFVTEKGALKRQALMKAEGIDARITERDGKYVVVEYYEGEVRKTNKSYLLKFHDEGTRAGMKDLGLNKSIPLLHGVNNYMRNIFVIMNPVLPFTNLPRDVKTMLVHNLGEYDAAVAKQTIKDIMPAMAGIWSCLRGDGTSEWAQLYAKAKSLGVPMGYQSFRTNEEMLNEVERKLKRYKGRSLFKYLHQLGDYVKDYNQMFEMGTRLAMFKNITELAGVPDKAAARIVKNVTVNFTKRGHLTGHMNALYLFSGASIKGTANIFKYMGVPGKPKNRTERRVQKIMAGLVVSSFLESMLNRMIDPDDWEQFDDHVKDNYQLLFTPFGRSLSIKSAYGYNIFKVLGNVAEESVNGDITLPEAYTRILKGLSQAFNPIEGGSAFQTISPTALDPFAQIIENKNWYGGPIRKEQPPYGVEKPRTELHFKTVWKPTKEFTDWVNRLTGGNEDQPGRVLGVRTDVNPENIDHIISSYTGGLGKFIGNAVNTLAVLATGDVPEPKSVPVMRQLTKESSLYKARSTVYDMLRQSGFQVYSKTQENKFHRNLRVAVEQGQMTTKQARDARKRFRDTQQDARLSAKGITSSERKKRDLALKGSPKPLKPPKPPRPRRPARLPSPKGHPGYGLSPNP